MLQVKQDEWFPNTALKMMPPGAIMGDHPEYVIQKKNLDPPEGYYVPDISFYDSHADQIQNFVDRDIWTIVGFNGGMVKGSGYVDEYGWPIGLVEAPVDNQDFYVMDDPTCGDILLVKAEEGYPEPIPLNPVCEHFGYKCECDRIPPHPVDNKKPIFPNCPDYEFMHYDVAKFNDLAASLTVNGEPWDNSKSAVVPTGYFEHWLELDQPVLTAKWGYADFDEWRFGITVEDVVNGGYEDWCPMAGVLESDETDKLYYRYIMQVPDND